MWRTDLTRASSTWLPLLLRALPEARSLRPPRPESEYVTESGDIIAGSFCRTESAAAGSVLRHGAGTGGSLTVLGEAQHTGLRRYLRVSNRLEFNVAAVRHQIISAPLHCGDVPSVLEYPRKVRGES